jgi:hypothetical protein
MAELLEGLQWAASSTGQCSFRTVGIPINMTAVPSITGHIGFLSINTGKPPLSLIGLSVDFYGARSIGGITPIKKRRLTKSMNSTPELH